MSNNPLKVLVLSGGGIFGMIPCHFLSLIEDEDFDKIDVIAGTSIGGILALCYASELGVEKTRRLFKEAAPKIFKRNIFRRLMPGKTLYSSKQIESFLQKNLPGKVKDCPKKFVVPCMNFRKKSLVIFQNLDESYSDYDLWKIGRSTSAAPIFFEPFSESILIDGGIIENVPIGIMFSMIQKHLGIAQNKIDVFVLGSGMNHPDDDITLKKVKRFSLVRWAVELLPIIATEANEMLSIIVGKNLGFRNFQYFNPVTIQGRLDDASQIEDGTLEEGCEIYNSIFLQEWKKFLNF